MTSIPSPPEGSLPYLDREGRTDAETYLMKVQDGTIVSCRHMKKLAEIMLPRIRNGYKQWHFDPVKALRPVAFIEKFCRIPSGEKSNMPFFTVPYERAVIEIAFGFVDDEGKRQFREVLVEWARKNGKALALDTEIPTPDGWRLMRDIHVGDVVFGQDGRPSTVVAESETFDKPMYLVTFEDGATIKASADHIWTVCDEHGLSKRDLCTKEMYEKLFYGARYHVPTLSHPVDYHLVDKSSSVGDFYDKGFVQSLGWFYPDDSEREAIRFASVAKRRAYTHGLEDGARHNGLACPVWDNVEFAEFAAEVASSVGLVASVTRAPRLDSWCVTIEEKPAKAITGIKAISNEPSKCIAIDNDSHLYLAGRQYTATHNTSVLAALNLYMLTSDGEGGAEVYNGATSDAQARLCYGATNDMVEMSPKLKKRIRRGMVQKRGVSGLNYDAKQSYLCTISSNSKKLDGLNAHFAVLDELAACEDGGATYDLLTESMSSRSQPMLFIISTENYVRDNIFDERKKYAYGWLDGKIEDDFFIPFLYELDNRDEIHDELMWPKANPGLLDGVKKWEYLRNRVDKAKQSPARMPSLLTKEFNLPSNSYASFLTYDEAVNRDVCDFDWSDIGYCVVGFDLADKGDLNAAVAMLKRPDDDHIYERAMFWIASDQIEITSNNFRQRDGVPYHQWAADGLLRVVEGDKVNQLVIVEWLRELVDEGIYPFAVGYDPWHVDDWTERELQRLVGESRVKSVPQYAKHISPLMKEHRLDLRANRIIDDDNPVLQWCRSNVNAKADNNDNYFPQKKDLRPQNRIDGYMAELFAYSALKRFEEEYTQMVGM